jgi:hypothetical protein
MKKANMTLSMLALALCLVIVINASPIMAQNVDYISSTLYSGPIGSIAIDSNYVYCTGKMSLEIFNISDSGTPILIGGFPFSTSTNGIFTDGNYAYIAARDGGLAIIDKTNHPVQEITGNYDTPGFAMSVFVNDNYAYIADGDSGLQIIQVTNPSDPNYAGSCSLPGYAYDVFISEDYAYVAAGNSGLQVVDISDPANPYIFGSAHTEWSALSVYVDGNHAYVLDYLEDPPLIFSSLNIYNITNPDTLILEGRYQFDGALNDIRICGEFAYVALGASLAVFDISDPAEPNLVGSFYGDDWFVVSVFIHGESVYLGGERMLQVISVADPFNPTLEGWYDTPYNPVKVRVDSMYAYVGASVGFHIVDIQDPINPVPLGLYRESAFPQSIRDLFVLNNYAYLACNLGGFNIIDMSDPSMPIRMGGYPGSAYSVFARRNLVYLMSSPSPGFKILNIADPSNPELIGSNSTHTGFMYHLSVFGDYAYLVSHYGLFIYDVSDSTNPQVIENYQINEHPVCGQIAGNYAYICYENNSLHIIDISNPLNPIHEGTYNTVSEVDEITIKGDYAYLVCNGVHVVDISIPQDPIFAGSFQTPGNTKSIDCFENYIFVADNYSLLVLDYHQTGIDQAIFLPTSFSLFPNYPNPFNASTTIQYNLPKASNVTIDIYDILGRKVETLVSQRKQPGMYTVVWDAKDIPSGIYFYKLQAGDYSQSKKCVILK